MRKKRLLWQLYPSYLLITVISLLAVGWYSSRAMHQFYLERAVSDLQTRARLLEEDLPENLGPQSSALIDNLCKELGKVAATRFTVILPTGAVIGDSVENPASMDNHADRPEFMEAMNGRVGASTRHSYTTEENMLYVTIPHVERDAVVYVVRAAVPITSIDDALRTIYVKIAGGGLVIALLASIVSLAVSRRLSRPLAEMKRAAERFARGEMAAKLRVPATEEIGGLAEAMNQMAAQLDERIRTIAQQRNELEAVLSSMLESVIAVDSDERIISLNRAAADLIGAELHARGRTIQEVCRNPDLQRFVAETLSGRELIEREIVLWREGEQFLQARGVPLKDTQGRGIGAVVVLNDVTRLKRLEDIRREFVANASHELRTPITSIKGFVETLLDGAMSDPENAKHFFQIIAKQADRLNAIVEDMLNLSKIERETERGEIRLEEAPLKNVLHSAIVSCEGQARAKNIEIELECKDDLSARLNPALLQQAVENLLDNAIKFSAAGTFVKVEATQTESEIVVSVRDQGCGIPQEHLPRLFERFYTVDKTRSRKLGGTGLGLAIVKHIAQAHGGRVSVESTPGKGSIFRIHLPKA